MIVVTNITIKYKYFLFEQHYQIPPHFNDKNYHRDRHIGSCILTFGKGSFEHHCSPPSVPLGSIPFFPLGSGEETLPSAHTQVHVQLQRRNIA